MVVVLLGLCYGEPADGLESDLDRTQSRLSMRYLQRLQLQALQIADFLQALRMAHIEESRTQACRSSHDNRERPQRSTPASK